MSDKRVTYKIKYTNNEIRRFSNLEKESNLKWMLEMLNLKEAILKYKDDEGDLITIKNEQDFGEMLMQLGEKDRIELTVNAELKVEENNKIQEKIEINNNNSNPENQIISSNNPTIENKKIENINLNEQNPNELNPFFKCMHYLKKLGLDNKKGI